MQSETKPSTTAVGASEALLVATSEMFNAYEMDHADDFDDT